MEKNLYETPVVEMVDLTVSDVIMTSGDMGADDGELFHNEE